MSALDAGYDIRASGVTLDRFCGSGITRANLAAQAVMSSMEDLVVSGGTEMMSLPKKGVLPMGANNPHLQEIRPQSHQGVGADAIATLEGISRQTLDELAALSQFITWTAPLHSIEKNSLALALLLNRCQRCLRLKRPFRDGTTRRLVVPTATATSGRKRKMTKDPPTTPVNQASIIHTDPPTAPLTFY